MPIKRSGFDIAKANEIYQNRDMFNPKFGSYDKTKSKISWMDPVVYYDTQKLYKGGITVQSLQHNLV
jgi:hypothetical protein